MENIYESTRRIIERTFKEKNIRRYTSFVFRSNKGLTDQQKEERAGQMVSVLNDSSDEQMFIDGLKEKGLI